MKHTLAENMLRFGVKNLSESNIKNLQEAEPTPAAPAAAATTTKPAGQAERRTFESTFNANQGGKIIPAKVTGYAIKQPDGSFKPGGITMSYPKSASGYTYIGLINSNGMYIPQGVYAKTDAMQELVLASAGISKGPLPVTALKNVIAQISAFTKTPLSLNPSVERGLALPAAKSANAKSVKQPITTGILKPYGTAFLQVTYNPETDIETKREIWIGGTNQYSFAKSSTGQFGPNAAASNYDSLYKKLGMTGTTQERKQVAAAAEVLYNELSSKL